MKLAVRDFTVTTTSSMARTFWDNAGRTGFALPELHQGQLVLAIAVSARTEPDDWVFIDQRLLAAGVCAMRGVTPDSAADADVCRCARAA
jgi:hypothetical protein